MKKVVLLVMVMLFLVLSVAYADTDESSATEAAIEYWKIVASSQDIIRYNLEQLTGTYQTLVENPPASSNVERYERLNQSILSVLKSIEEANRGLLKK